LTSVLALPFDEALQCLKNSPRTASPISAIYEQINLIHLSDVYVRFFVHLVKATTSGNSRSVKTLATNLGTHASVSSLKSTGLDSEIKGLLEGTPKGSTSHSLGLVLIGLWGLLTGSSPSSQVHLARELSAEEMRGSPVSSVHAIMDLLYSASASPSSTSSNIQLQANAVAIDKLALVCIEYIRLLSTSSTLTGEETRLQRQEASAKVQRATSDLRMILTETRIVGLGEETAESGFEEAREQLVETLSIIGRRAAGRMTGRDEDSGMEGDLEDL
jgi:hypothetical protein